MLCFVSNLGRFLLATQLVVVWGAVSARAESANFPPLYRISALMRMTVENRDGKELGRIRDIVVDADRGTLQAVLFGQEGFFAGRKPLRAVPPQLLSPATAKRDVIAVNVSWKDWIEAPSFEPGELNAFEDPAALEKIRKHYKMGSQVPGRAGSANPAAELTQTGRKAAGRVASRMRTLSVSELLGKPVLGENSEKLGEVVDVLVAMDEQTPAHLLVVPNRALGGANHGLALPLRFVDVADGKMKANVSLAELAKGPVFHPRRWLMGEFASVSWFRYPLQP